MTRGSPTLSFETMLAHRERMADVLPDDQKAVSEVFVAAEWKYLSEDQIVAEGGKKVAGRLGQMAFAFKTADTLNQNRRIYPSSVVKVAVADLQTRIAKNVVFGNLDHPSMWDQDSLIVRLSDACVKISECKMTTDTDVRVVMDVLDNQFGKQLSSVMAVGGNPGCSQRAMVRWRDPTDEEKKRHNVPSDAYVVVADAMRLITYDVVSEPGFVDADEPTITESKSEGAAMTLEELKAKYPAIYAAAVADGRAAAAGEVESKIAAGVAAAKPAIVAEAVKPVNDQLAAKTAELGEVKKSLEAFKPVLVKYGVVNEQITDAQAAARLVTAENKATDLQGQIDALKTQITQKDAEVAKANAAIAVGEALRAVSAEFKSHPAHNVILSQLASHNIADKNAAIEKARGIAAFIESINPALKPAADGKTTSPNASGGVNPILESLLISNPANSLGSSMGGGGGGLTGEQKSAHAILTGAMPLI